MIKNLFLKSINFYQRFLSPILSTYLNLHCRYIPSCSEYAKIALQEWGIWRGSLLALKRLLKCNPLFPGGYDYPPSKKHTAKEAS
ncbi:MAG: membrane protein insertion efficiency factor YidD [Caldimicrobium sp.]|nr:membrane protein insertion efficiency factor YidD [Caldimicrobium sp.]MCX7873342.1 membrane protein insertion efficiency factor YidD [Caldimicrobium sp.]MDW8093420.1 membrane protein insertion efficiency factor YidD [Caldimicrobium sp.]